VSHPSTVERIRQTRRLLRSEGYRGVAARLAKRISNRLAPPGHRSLPVARSDLLRAAEIAAAGWRLPPPLPAAPGESLCVAWVCTPPDAGSGGHTTMFRLVSALEQSGHTCIIYVKDDNGWSLDQRERIIRSWWPWVRADVRDATSGVEDAHAIFATGWETAYSVLASPARGVRFYLVQDFEPSFYPAGSEALMAEATYRFGFHGVTAGRWLAERLRRDYGMSADPFEFGRDASYVPDSSVSAAKRTGVCLFSKPGAPRRAFELAVLALDLFAARHPEADIHLFGQPAGRLPFAATDHGLCTPEQLNQLYNRCVAGLVLSATNVSLVPYEMLAAGCIPVVNDAEHNRMVLHNPQVAYAPATPFELAEKLSALVARPLAERTAAAAAAAASVNGTSWDDAGATVERIVREAVEGAAVTEQRARV
jgi:glycosyltransferase involved in cell wall biosynthesis